jgi:phosphatidylinositol alpha-1,6-mannosyltransferase
MVRRLFVSIDFPPEKGGIQNYVYGIVSNLNPEESFVLTSNRMGPEETQSFDRSQPFKIYRTDLSGKSRIEQLYQLMKLIFILIYLKVKLRYEEIHFGNVLPISLVGPILKVLLGVRYVNYTFGLDVKGTFKFNFTNKLLLVSLKHANKIICVSNYTKQVIVDMGISPRMILIVHPGIDIVDTKNKDDLNYIKKRYDLKNKKIILTVARLVERKGHDVVLKSLKLISNEMPSVRYVICGEGPDKNRLVSLIKEYNLDEFVVFTGALENDELRALYLVSDLFIMPSREIKEKGDVEGFGIVFLEANYYGLPVIGGNSGGVPDAILNGRTGYLVDPMNVSEICDKMKRLLSNDELAKEMGNNGHRWVIENCLWQHRVEVLNQLNLKKN